MAGEGLYSSRIISILVFDLFEEPSHILFKVVLS